MTLLSARVEVPNARGVPVLYPSFVKEIADGNPGGPLPELIDCWVPERRNDPVLDYVQGGLYFAAAHYVAALNERAAFLENVLHAMADHGQFGPIERGFVVPLCGRAMMGARPSHATTRRLAHIPPDEQRAFKDDAWDLVNVCRDISSVELLLDQAETAIACESAAPWNRVYLSVLAGLAYNGARH